MEILLVQSQLKGKLPSGRKETLNSDSPINLTDTLVLFSLFILNLFIIRHHDEGLFKTYHDI